VRNRENHRQQYHKNRSAHMATIGALIPTMIQLTSWFECSQSYRMFWSQKPTILIVWSDCRWLTAPCNAVWDSQWKCIGDTANLQVHRTRMNYNDRAVWNRLQMHTSTDTMINFTTLYSLLLKQLLALKFQAFFSFLFKPSALFQAAAWEYWPYLESCQIPFRERVRCGASYNQD